jgi:hypothetical protein
MAPSLRASRSALPSALPERLYSRRGWCDHHWHVTLSTVACVRRYHPALPREASREKTLVNGLIGGSGTFFCIATDGVPRVPDRPVVPGPVADAYVPAHRQLRCAFGDGPRCVWTSSVLRVGKGSGSARQRSPQPIASHLPLAQTASVPPEHRLWVRTRCKR